MLANTCIGTPFYLSPEVSRRGAAARRDRGAARRDNGAARRGSA
jgi:hypothetical protein